MFVFVNFWSAIGDAEDGGWRENAVVYINYCA